MTQIFQLARADQDAEEWVDHGRRVNNASDGTPYEPGRPIGAYAQCESAAVELSISATHNIRRALRD